MLDALCQVVADSLVYSSRSGFTGVDVFASIVARDSTHRDRSASSASFRAADAACKRNWNLARHRHEFTCAGNQTVLAEHTLVADCPRTPLLLNVPSQCSHLSECGAARNMTFLLVPSLGMHRMLNNKT